MNGRAVWVRRIRLSVALLPVALGLAVTPAAAGLVDVTKNMTISIPAGMLLTATGQGKVFATADSNAVQVFDNPPSSFFMLSGVADSLPTIKADAQLGDYRGIATARAGKAVGAGAVVNVPVVLGARVQWPEVPPPNGGFAVAISRVRIRGGTVTVNSVTVNKVTVNAPAQIPPLLNTAQDRGAVVLDPIHLFAQNLITGETIDTDVYANQYKAQGGGSVGFNSLGLLELSIPDVPASDTIAELDSSTLVPFATDLTGTANLVGGVLTATGVFYPDTSRPITDFWSLTFSPTDPTFIDDAVFLSSSQFAQLVISSPFTDPATSGSDPVTLELGMSLQAQESSTSRQFSVPEPASLGLFGLGFATLFAFLRRRRLPAHSGG